MTALWLEGSRRPATGLMREAPLPRRSRGGRVLARLREWRRRARDRTELAALDDRMLADIGLSRAEAEFLANKPFWRK